MKVDCDTLREADNFKRGLAVSFLCAAVLCACGASSMEQEHSDQKYFGTFVGYDLPLKLRENLFRTEAEERGTYYIAHYDSVGRLEEVRKVHTGATFFVHKYTYDAQGILVEARITNKAGEVSILKRGPDGKLVKD
jgi:hypothetical protein